MNSRGFTLVEVLIVTLIISVLMIALLNVGLRVNMNSRDTKRAAIMNDIRQALGRYNLANFKYPDSDFCTMIQTLTVGNFLVPIPQDPKTKSDICNGSGGGAVYYYVATPSSGTYLLKLGKEGGGALDFNSPQ